ncbi:sigma-70 family RNA polymerase sigma factor [Demequina sediminicola]|uniref:sigma-70 family RNA polymerase sigma factor n=1 Tax=Demequina sediminicola TaxID=1095026 RepID=UPI000AC71055|nr:sigma-70 family RNA polymerase sigma factor [Demequina sediminicola]
MDDGNDAMSAERHLRAVPASATSSAAGADAGVVRDAHSPAALAMLLESTARGDEEAFQRLYDLVAAAVFGLALRIVRDREMAQDVAQEALVEVWRQSSRFDRTRGTARSWILTIAHRRAVDRVRSEQAHATRMLAHGATSEVDHGEQDDVVDQLHNEWQVARVRSGLTLLTGRQREAIELTYFKGYTHREVAHALNIPLGTAKARIRDALIKLRDAWETES